MPAKELKLPLETNMDAPTKPTNTPIYCNVLGLLLKANTPIINVKNGVKPLRIPARELGTCVCASGNKKAGKKFPKKPLASK